LDLDRRGERIGSALAEAADELGVAKSHVWRLYRLLKKNGGRASALEPNRSGPKRGSRRLGADVEKLIDETLRKRYLVAEAPSFLRVVGEIRAACAASGYQPPARQTIKARLDAMDQRDVLRKQKGAKAAREAFAPVSGAYNVDRPLEVVQIDHTLADIILVDHVDRKPLHRPWLTVAIDVATRLILGFYVSFDAPSVLSVALCLDHCFRDKSIGRVKELEGLPWPTAGIPKAIHVDNAQEFRSHAFQEACDEWGIEVNYRPPGRPHYGGHVERLIGTCMGAVHVLPGTTNSSPQNNGDYDSVGTASMTLSEFEDWLALEVFRYHAKRHGSLERTPLAAWAHLVGDDVGRRVVDHDAFLISFMPFERRKLGRTGIKLFSIQYWSDAFAPIIGQTSGPLMIKYDPRDLSSIWVITEEGRTVEARYRDLSRPRISWWEYKYARKVYREQQGGQISEHTLFQIIQEQRRIAESSRKMTRAARQEQERSARRPTKNAPKDPARAMFAIDTSNPDLPTFEIDDSDGTK
jgi:putative transposase